MKRKIQLIVGLLLSILGLWLALRQVEWSALGAALQEVRPAYLLLAVLAELLSLAVNAVRWRWLYWPRHGPSVGHLFGILGVAQLVNLALPARLGLPVRALLAGGEQQAGYPATLSTLVVEKALEGITLLPLVIVLFLSLELPDWLRVSALVSVGLLVALVLALLAGIVARNRLLAWFEHRWLRPLRRPVEAFLQGLKAVTDLRSAWRLWLCSLVYWLAIAAVNYLVLESLDLGQGWMAALLLLCVLQVGSRLPSSPGNLGVFDYLGVVSLAVFGVAKPAALAATLLLHAVFYLPASLLGAGYLLWRGIGLGQLFHSALEHRP